MLDSIASILGLLALAGSAVFVFAVGGWAERGGMALIAISWLGMLLAQAATGEVVPELPFLVSDVALSLGFLVLAVRFASLWLGSAMLVQAVLFGLHLLRFENEFAQQRLYLAGVNGLSYCVLVIIVLGAAASWRRRIRSARAARKASLAEPIFQPRHAL